jgi:hypothetical protein
LFVPRQDSANLRAGQRLVDFHARPPGVGEDRIHPFAFEAGNEDFAAGHCGSEFRVLSGSLCQAINGLAHSLFNESGSRREHKKTHDRWPAVGSCQNRFLRSTRPCGVAAYDDDQQNNLPNQ